MLLNEPVTTLAAKTRKIRFLHFFALRHFCDRRGSQGIGIGKQRSSVGRQAFAYGSITVGYERRSARKPLGADQLRLVIGRTTSAHGSGTVGYGCRSARKQSCIGQRQSVTRRLTMGHGSDTVGHGQPRSRIDKQSIGASANNGRPCVDKRSRMDRTRSATGGDRRTNSRALTSLDEP